MSLTGRRERAIETPAGVNEHTFITVYCIPGFNCFCFFGGFLNSTFLRDGDSFRRSSLVSQRVKSSMEKFQGPYGLHKPSPHECV